MTTASRLMMTEEGFLEKYADELPSYEFVNGVVTRKPMTKRSRFLLADEISGHLRDYRRRAGGMSGQEPTVNFNQSLNRVYRVPDVAYWAGTKDRGGEVMLPPTLAVEIPSPGQSMDELRDKCRFMRDSGTDVCWLIDPDERRAEVFEGGQDGVIETGTLQSAHLPGFRLELSKLFAVLE